MGLTIHYNLTLLRRLKFNSVKNKLEALRQRCLDLPFKSVGEIKSLSKAAGDVMDWRDKKYDHVIGPDGKNTERPAEWDMLYGTSTEMLWKFKWNAERAVPVKIKKNDKSAKYYIMVPPEAVIGFFAWPGEGCESSDIFMGLPPIEYPFAVTVAEKERAMLWSGEKAKVGGPWAWRGFTKTQYANDPRCGGLENFIRCHLCVVAMLDAAKELGFAVEVHDESDYWKTRDLKALIKTIGEWDQFIAALGSAVQDVAGSGVVTQMDGRPDREVLELRGFQNPKVVKLIEATTGKKINVG